MVEVGELIPFDKQQLTRVYRAWVREEIESIELIEAVGKYVKYREPRSAAKAESKAALLSERDELQEALSAVRRRVKNARGAIESDQVIDKDVHGSLTRVLDIIDTALAGKGVKA